MNDRTLDPSAATGDPRQFLLMAVRAFVHAICGLAGLHRIALIGSLTTGKPTPKDADVLVTIDPGLDLTDLARAARRLKGAAQARNLGADIFLADPQHHYLGRVCQYRQCHPRVACRAQNCGRYPHLNDDLQIVTLATDLIAAPPVDLWPTVVRRISVPDDVEDVLLAGLQDRIPSARR
jgi:hypothetical protein